MAKKKLFRFRWPIPPLLTGYLVAFLLLTSFITWIVFFRSPLKDVVRYTAAPIQKISTSSGQSTILPDDLFPQYLTTMGIRSIGIPKSWGKPSLENDIKENDDGLPYKQDGYLPEYIKGRLVDLSFGQGCHLQYETSDFSYPSEYIAFSRKNDYSDLRSGKRKADLHIDGKPAIIMHMSLIYISNEIARSISIPFADHSVSLWCFFPARPDLGMEQSAWREEEQRFERNELTQRERERSEQMTSVAKTIQFIK